MSKANELIGMFESLLSPGFFEFSQFVFRDYDNKYNAWVSKGGVGEQPKLMPIINKNYKKFVGYNSSEFNYTLQEVIEKYFDYQLEQTKKHVKPEKVVWALSSYGLNTLPDFNDLVNRRGISV